MRVRTRRWAASSYRIAGAGCGPSAAGFAAAIFVRWIFGEACAGEIAKDRIAEALDERLQLRLAVRMLAQIRQASAASESGGSGADASPLGLGARK